MDFPIFNPTKLVSGLFKVGDKEYEPRWFKANNDGTVHVAERVKGTAYGGKDVFGTTALAANAIPFQADTTGVSVTNLDGVNHLDIAQGVDEDQCVTNFLAGVVTTVLPGKAVIDGKAELANFYLIVADTLAVSANHRQIV